MRTKHLLTKTLLAIAGLCVGSTSAWAEGWSTVWSTDFSSAPSGMTYSISAGSCNITNGYLWYKNDAGSGTRTQTATFTADAFKVSTNWKMEFDWNCGLSNGETSSVAFTTNNGTAFTISWGNNGTTATVSNAASTSLTTTLPPAGYNINSISSWSHIVVTGDTENGIYLTITNGATTYVNNALVTATYGYPASFSGTLGKSVAAMGMDNIDFAIPAVAGFVAAPTSTITGAYNTQRKFTLSCLTDNTTIYYASSDLEKGAAGWTEYTGEVTTGEATIYAYAKDDSDNTSEKMSFATGAGTTISLATPTISASGFTNTDGTKVSNPKFSFACDNSGVLGTPTATLSYTFTPDGGVESSETVGTSFTPTAYGTLKVIASANGYTSSEKSLSVSALYIISFTGRDYTTAETSDVTGATWGGAYTVEWADWASGLTAYLSSAFTDDLRLNVQNASTISLVPGWGLVRGDQKTYGYRIRYTKEGEFVALKENTSKGADATANTYQTAYCANGTGTITDLITITAPASSAVQQVFFYSPVAVSVSTTLDASGYATLASAYPLDVTTANMTASTGTVTAYKAAVSGTAVSFTALDQTIPENTGILLKGDANATVTIPVVASGTAVTENAFLVNNTGATFTGDDDYYYFAMKKDAATLTFAKFEPSTLAFPANKAYLKVAKTNFAGGAPSLIAIFDGGQTTGIDAVKGSELTVDGEYYNLAGQRVAQPTKGLYIVNGKKVVVK